MNLLRQKALTREVMETILPISPTAIVAGGAPRDWYFNNQAQDVDIFLYRPDLNTPYFVKQVFKSVGLPITTLDTSLMEDGVGHGTYFLNPRISQVYEMMYSGLKFQFILMKEPTFTSVVPHFPLNLSRIWYKDGDIHPTHEFLHGVENKALIKLDELYADGNRYVTKIRERFPDYQYYASVQEFYFSDKGKVHYGH